MQWIKYAPKPNMYAFSSEAKKYTIAGEATLSKKYLIGADCFNIVLLTALSEGDGICRKAYRKSQRLNFACITEYPLFVYL